MCGAAGRAAAGGVDAVSPASRVRSSGPLDRVRRSAAFPGAARDGASRPPRIPRDSCFARVVPLPTEYRGYGLT
jgi:hypothetical protein